MASINAGLIDETFLLRSSSWVVTGWRSTGVVGVLMPERSKGLWPLLCRRGCPNKTKFATDDVDINAEFVRSSIKGRDPPLDCAGVELPEIPDAPVTAAYSSRINLSTFRTILPTLFS